MNPYKSPLRYPGGKSALAPYVADLINHNNLADCTYAEAYCGGAGVALELVTREVVQKALINDADFRIYAFWRSVFQETEELLKLLHDTPVHIREWHKQKAILTDYRNHAPVIVGFAAFFLNRTNRSGILSGGPIGGYKQQGPWTLTARFSKSDLASRIEFLAQYSNRIKPSNLDALVFLRQLRHKHPAAARLFTYLDPPYYSMGDRLYLNYYSSNDHAQLARHLSNQRSLKWLLSYDDVSPIRGLYARFRMVPASIAYHLQARKIGQELMIFAPTLSIPDSMLQSIRPN